MDRPGAGGGEVWTRDHQISSPALKQEAMHAANLNRHNKSVISCQELSLVEDGNQPAPSQEHTTQTDDGCEKSAFFCSFYAVTQRSHKRIDCVTVYGHFR